MRVRLEVEILLNELEKRLKNCEVELASSPQGELYQVHRGGVVEFYCATRDGNGRLARHSLRKEPDVAAALARKAYLREEHKRLKEDADYLKQILDIRQGMTAENVIGHLPERFQRLPKEWLLGIRNEPKILTKADQWAAASYRQSNYKPEEKRKITSRGLHVRSMAEVVCCERYYYHDVPFRYEAVLEIDGYTFAPDFTLMRRRDGKIFYHEHCGLPHVPRYRDRHKWKMQMYERAGIVPWDNLIVTYGDKNGNVDVRGIESEIVNRLL